MDIDAALIQMGRESIDFGIVLLVFGVGIIALGLLLFQLFCVVWSPFAGMMCAPNTHRIGLSVRRYALAGAFTLIASRKVALKGQVSKVKEACGAPTERLPRPVHIAPFAAFSGNITAFGILRECNDHTTVVQLDNRHRALRLQWQSSGYPTNK